MVKRGYRYKINKRLYCLKGISSIMKKMNFIPSKYLLVTKECQIPSFVELRDSFRKKQKQKK